MQINLRKKQQEIRVSDIVLYYNPNICVERYVCMVIGNGYKYSILNLNTGLIVTTYNTLEDINRSNYIELIAKSENTKLVILEE